MDIVKFNAHHAFSRAFNTRSCFLLAINRENLGEDMFFKIHYRRGKFMGFTGPLLKIETAYTLNKLDKWVIISIPCTSVESDPEVKIKAIELRVGNFVYVLTRRVTVFKNPFAENKKIETVLTLEEPVEPHYISKVSDAYIEDAVLEFMRRMKGEDFNGEELAVQKIDKVVEPEVPEKKVLSPFTSVFVNPRNEDTPAVPYWFDKQHWEAFNEVYFAVNIDNPAKDLWDIWYKKDCLKALVLDEIFSKYEIQEGNSGFKVPRVPPSVRDYVYEFTVEDWDRIFCYLAMTVYNRLVDTRTSPLNSFPVDIGRQYLVTCIEKLDKNKVLSEKLAGYKILTDSHCKSCFECEKKVWIKIDPKTRDVTESWGAPDAIEFCRNSVVEFERLLRTVTERNRVFIAAVEGLGLAFEELVLNAPFGVVIDECMGISIDHPLLPLGYVFYCEAEGLSTAAAQCVRGINTSEIAYAGLFTDERLTAENESYLTF